MFSASWNAPMFTRPREEADRDLVGAAVLRRPRESRAQRNLPPTMPCPPMNPATGRRDASTRPCPSSIRLLAEEFGHDGARRHAARQCLAMFAVCADHVIVRTKRRHRADGNGLLADVQVAEAADLADGVRLARALLEPADQDHHAQPLAVLISERGCGVGPLASRWVVDRGGHHALSSRVDPAAASAGCRRADRAWSQAWYDERVNGDASTCEKPIASPISRNSANSSGV